MIKFLRDLTGNEIKVLMVILYDCDDKHEYRNLESIMKYNITYPTILKCTERLKTKKIIEWYDSGVEIMVRLREPWIDYSYHLKKFPILFEPDVEEKPKLNIKEIREFIRDYALAQGVENNQEELSKWYRSNFKKLITPSAQIIKDCGSIQVAKVAMRNCQIHHERQRIPWSLAGVLKRDLHKYIPNHRTDDKGEKEWL